MAQKNEDSFQVLATKVDPAMAEVLDACCNAMQVDVYHLLQWFTYTIIRAAAPLHELDPRIQKLMAMMDNDFTWQKAFNIADRSEVDVEQCVLILRQKEHRGTGAVLIDKPFFESARQTECVDDILEQVVKTTVPGIYRRLRQVMSDMNCDGIVEILLTMLEEQQRLIAEADLASEGPQFGEYTNSGGEYAYGNRTKAKQKRTVDSYAMDRRTFFDELNDKPDLPTQDWEGEHRQHDAPPNILNL